MPPKTPAPPAGTAPPDAPLSWSRLLGLVWPLLKEFPVRASLAMVALLAAKGLNVIVPLGLQRLVDSFTPGNRWAGLALGLAAAYALVRFASTLMGELRDFLFSRVTERAMRRSALTAFEHLHRLDLDFHLSRRTGALGREIERGVNGLELLARLLLFNVVPTIFELVLVLGILTGKFEFRLALVALAAVVAFIAFSVTVTERRTPDVRKANELDSKAGALSVDSLLNYETVKYASFEGPEARRYDAAMADYETMALKNRRTLTVLNLGQALIVNLSLGAMLWLTARAVGRGEMTVGALVAVNAYVLQLFAPLNFLGVMYREIRRATVDLARMFSLLDRQAKVTDPQSPVRLPEGALAIAFDDVVFGYQKGRTVLHGVDFAIPAGQTLAVVGPSGAGKSSITRLLFRFYDPAGGAVRLGGTDIRHVTQDELRRAIAVVPQDVVLFNDTLGYNLAYGAPDVSDAEVLAAAENARLGELIRALPEGLATPVGERGLKLSGGEKQRVALVRALLKPNARVLVLDEATSALDSASERGVLETLSRGAGRRTVLAIAHRLSTIAHADRIVVLDQGRVVEQGRHEELLALDGLYAKLWRLQQVERDEDERVAMVEEGADA